MNAVQCGPLKRRKYPQVVIGSINAPFGYRIHERSGCKVVPLPKSFEHFEEEKRREYEQVTKVLDFEKETNRRIGKKKVWQRVQQGTDEELVLYLISRSRTILVETEGKLVRGCSKAPK